MRRILLGGVLVIAGIAGFIEAHSHAPEYRCPSSELCSSAEKVLASGLSRTAYDLLRIGAWALVIIGGLVVVTGLIRYWRRPA